MRKQQLLDMTNRIALKFIQSFLRNCKRDAQIVRG
jgi:hypothetical protein